MLLLLLPAGEAATPPSHPSHPTYPPTHPRTAPAEEKRLKLRSPNFVVSATRLSVRNIPRSWTEAQLRSLFLAAVRERASKEHPRVKQAKILVEAEAKGPDGAPRSKGIGFVEFEDPSHALAALRQLNNNPQAWGKVGGCGRGGEWEGWGVCWGPLGGWRVAGPSRTRRSLSVGRVPCWTAGSGSASCWALGSESLGSGLSQLLGSGL